MLLMQAFLLRRSAIRPKTTRRCSASDICEVINRSLEFVFSNDCAALRLRTATQRSENKLGSARRIEAGRRPGAVGSSPMI